MSLYSQGGMVRQPYLAKTQQNIESPPDEVKEYFYISEFTDELVNEVNQYGGIFKKEDLMNYNYEVNEYSALTQESDQLNVLDIQELILMEKC